MQKDIATGVGEALAEGLNRMNDGTQTKSLMSLVKRQAEEIDRRGQIMTRMEETIRMQQENIERLTQQTKHLESLVETLRMEREKIVEEIQLLKAAPKVTKTKAVKEKAVSGTSSEAA